MIDNHGRASLMVQSGQLTRMKMILWVAVLPTLWLIQEEIFG